VEEGGAKSYRVRSWQIISSLGAGYAQEDELVEIKTSTPKGADLIDEELAVVNILVYFHAALLGAKLRAYMARPEDDDRCAKLLLTQGTYLPRCPKPYQWKVGNRLNMVKKNMYIYI
jgi:hypothetical protein